jgi:hypothetical protein
MSERDLLAEIDALRAKLTHKTLAYNAANAMSGVHQRRADNLREQLNHANAALAGDNDAVAAFMADHEAKTQRVREARDMWQREAEKTEAVIDRFRDFLDRDFRQWCSPNGVAAQYAGDLIGILDRMLDDPPAPPVSVPAGEKPDA